MKAIPLSAVALLLWTATDVCGAGLAYSPNFIVSASGQPLADAVLAKAESYRERLAQQWLGDQRSADTKRVVIRVIVSDEKDYGLTRIERDPDQDKCHSMWIVTSADRIDATLAHEMTHIVFGRQHHERLPIWANEGAASLQDDPQRTRIRNRIIAEFARSGRWPDLMAIFNSPEFLTSDQESYAVSASVTEFFLSLGSKPAFVQFTVDGRSKGWDAALLQHYGVANVRALQVRWQNWVKDHRANGGSIEVMNASIEKL